MRGSEKLARTAGKVQLLARENPCGWGDSVLSAIADGIDIMMGERTKNGVSQMDLASYYGVTVRTIERWRTRYPDFPSPIDPYAKILSYPTDSVVDWKLSHPDLF